MAPPFLQKVALNLRYDRQRSVEALSHTSQKRASDRKCRLVALPLNGEIACVFELGGQLRKQPTHLIF